MLSTIYSSFLNPMEKTFVMIRPTAVLDSGKWL
jgi:hypothetical protein